MRNPFAVAARSIVASDAWRPQAYFRGAAHDRFNLDWTYSQLSADWVLRMHLQTLRNRARELVANDSAAATIPALFAENIVGKDGIGMQSLMRSTRGELNARVNDKIEDAWYRWAEGEANGRFFASADRKLAWPELQALIVRTEPTDGEVVIRLVDGFDNPFRFSIDLLDADQIDHTLNRAGKPGENAIVMGVEIDGWGAPVAYHLFSNHPSETARGGRERTRVSAEDIIVQGLPWRPKQTRYVTWFAPVLMDLRMLSGYRLAELMAARAGAAHSGYIHGDPEKGYDPPKDEKGNYVSDVSQDIEPLSLQRLLPGETITFADPKHPTTAYEPFEKAMLRGIASALRVSYMSLTGDLNSTSYGSGRIGMLNERAVYEQLQQRFIRKVCKPIFRRWFKMAVLSGQLELDSYDLARYESAVQWHARPFPWIDPEKDIDAVGKEVDMGVNTLTRICQSKGLDFEEVMQERAAEIEIAERYKVPITLPGGKAAGAPAPDERGANEPDAKPADDEDEDTDTAAIARRRMRLARAGGT